MKKALFALVVILIAIPLFVGCGTVQDAPLSVTSPTATTTTTEATFTTPAPTIAPEPSPTFPPCPEMEDFEDEADYWDAYIKWIEREDNPYVIRLTPEPGPITRSNHGRDYAGDVFDYVTTSIVDVPDTNKEITLVHTFVQDESVT